MSVTIGMLRISAGVVFGVMVTACLSLALSRPACAQAPAKTQPKTYSPEQTEAAKKLAKQIGGRLKEDADGNVIAIDMAAGRSWADDYQMQQILVFPKLATLVVEGPGITNQLIPRIAQQQQLTSLTLKNTLVDDDGIAKLAGLQSLKIVELRVAPMVTDRAMESLVKLPQLRAVRLVGGNVTDRGVATLLQAPQLAEVDVRNCRGVTKAGIEKIAKKETLRVLKIGGPAINDDVLAIVAGIKNLAGLCLENCDVTDAGLEKLGDLPLQDLAIHQCAKITDAGLQVLAKFAKLRQLTLQGLAAKGTALDKLPAPESLTVLNMQQSGVTDAEIPAILKLTHLESLNLSQTGLTDAAVESLSKLTSLKQLTITQTKISASGVERLQKALTGCTVRAN